MKSKTRKQRPYIGITGFKTKQQVQQTTEAFLKNGIPNLFQNYTAMYGYLVSHKRLIDDIPASQRFPALHDLTEVIKEAPKWSIPALHYCAYNEKNMVEDVVEYFSMDNMYKDGLCRAIQLNLNWPSIDKLEKILSDFPELEIIFQLPQLESHGNNIKKVRHYAADKW